MLRKDRTKGPEESILNKTRNANDDTSTEPQPASATAATEESSQEVSIVCF